MPKVRIFIFFLLLACPALIFSQQLPADFSGLLARAQLNFKKQKHFKPVPIIENHKMGYEYAIKHRKKNFEIRYTIRPLDEDIRKYKETIKQEGVIAADPNEWYPSMFMAISYNVSAWESRPTVTKIDAKEFNADWAASSSAPAREEFAQQYKYQFSIAIHKDKVADAYIYCLYDDPNDLSSLRQFALASLRFK